MQRLVDNVALPGLIGHDPFLKWGDADQDQGQKGSKAKIAHDPAATSGDIAKRPHSSAPLDINSRSHRTRSGLHALLTSHT
ncbi:MAG: hypothetical protein K2X59_12650 [Sphingomonas sp.]|nr:hypothetical protein [Sphingomonas sp.]